MDIRRFTGNVPTLIDPDDIDDSPGPFCMSFGFDIHPLINSIEAFGLINMPLVIRNVDGNVDIVAGYRRVKALKSMNRKNRIPCIDLSDSGLSQVDLLNLNLNDNITVRILNNVEKGMILNRLSNYVNMKAIQEEYMPLLELSNRNELDILMKIERFSSQEKEAIANGRISLRAIDLMLRLDKDSRIAVFRKINDLRFNFNQQLKFIEFIVDISISEEKNITELLAEKQLQDISHNKKLNTPQKAKEMLGILRRRRFPLLTGMEESFKKKIVGLGLPRNVRIDHPPFFETTDYRLEINFRTGKELKDTVDVLAQKEGLDRIGDNSKEES